MNAKEIEEAFLKDASRSGIVAYYIYNKREQNIVSVINRRVQKDGKPQFDLEGNLIT
jgi:hypothetical protein